MSSKSLRIAEEIIRDYCYSDEESFNPSDDGEIQLTNDTKKIKDLGGICHSSHTENLPKTGKFNLRRVGVATFVVLTVLVVAAIVTAIILHYTVGFADASKWWQEAFSVKWADGLFCVVIPVVVGSSLTFAATIYVQKQFSQKKKLDRINADYDIYELSNVDHNNGLNS